MASTSGYTQFMRPLSSFNFFTSLPGFSKVKREMSTFVISSGNLSWHMCLQTSSDPTSAHGLR